MIIEKKNNGWKLYPTDCFDIEFIQEQIPFAEEVEEDKHIYYLVKVMARERNTRIS